MRSRKDVRGVEGVVTDTDSEPSVSESRVPARVTPSNGASNSHTYGPYSGSAVFATTGVRPTTENTPNPPTPPSASVSTTQNGSGGGDPSAARCLAACTLTAQRASSSRPEGMGAGLRLKNNARLRRPVAFRQPLVGCTSYHVSAGEDAIECCTEDVCRLMPLPERWEDAMLRTESFPGCIVSAATASTTTSPMGSSVLPRS
mmetsp:Transcript_16791/g.50916  ORF Transcript_16791/g.50916 Transcript_16791/m.50916 type:complete len:202 (-) Transcript_16791:1048-1653(-)